MFKKSFVIALAMILSFTALQAQHLTEGIIKHKVHSKATGREYELFISLPQNYKSNDTTKYPVLYVLDGNFMFPVMQTSQRLLNEVGEVQDMIIVGVGYNATNIIAATEHRTPDYTPTKDTAFENMLLKEMKMQVKTGGADQFIQALKSDIFPYVSKNYRTGDKGIAGHSFGGLFGAYVLFREPALFNKYLLSSVSMPWDNGVMLKNEQAYFNAGNKSLNAHVFVTVGEQETWFDMIPLMKKLTASMKEHNYTGLKVEERVLQNESHGSAFLTAFHQGLRVLYKKGK